MWAAFIAPKSPRKCIQVGPCEAKLCIARGPCSESGLSKWRMRELADALALLLLPRPAPPPHGDQPGCPSCSPRAPSLQVAATSRAVGANERSVPKTCALIARRSSSWEPLLQVERNHARGAALFHLLAGLPPRLHEIDAPKPSLPYLHSGSQAGGHNRCCFAQRRLMRNTLHVRRLAAFMSTLAATVAKQSCRWTPITMVS